jgi:hypothetical protein
VSDKQKGLRAEINREIRLRAYYFGVDFGLIWWSAYENLFERTGYRPPEGASNKLDAVEAAGHLPTLLSVVHGMCRPGNKKKRRSRRSTAGR